MTISFSLAAEFFCIILYKAHVDPDTEKQIVAAIARHGSARLSPLKQVLPESVSYDQIRLVVAKMQRIITTA